MRTISFTGGTVTGEHITHTAGLKKLSLELGGKSPVLVFEDADLGRALDAALFTIFSINGERCTAGSRIFVQDSVYDAFAAEFVERAGRVRIGDPQDKATQLGALITPQHWEKVHGYVDLARQEGATVACGGERPSQLPPRVASGNFLQPTVFTDVDNRMRIAQEEIFGPVACLIRFKDEAEGLRLANDVSTAWPATSGPRISARPTAWPPASRAGMVFVNSQNVRDLRQPFGGVKSSGIGREGGEASFETFCEVKNVCVSLGGHHIPRWGVDAAQAH